MSNEEEKRCPLCAEEMDWTDQQLKPCKCGYEVCVWCWHHIMDMAEKDATEGRCPACRTPYDKDRIVGLEANFQRVAANGSSRKQKQPKAKQKPNETRKDLSSVRVIQRKMAYIIGLPLSLADEDLLQRKDYFGQYGKVTKVSLSRTAGGTVQQFINDTCSVYITYSKEEEAVRCIQSVHGYVLDGRFLRASFGTAKYCHAWLRNMPCNNPTCLYLHSIGADEDSFGKDEIAAIHTRNRVEEIVGAAQYLHKRSGSMLPSPVDQHLNNHNCSAEEPVFSIKGAAACLKEKDGVVRPSKNMTSFVDIVGRPCNSGSDMVNLCSDMSSVCINRGNLDKAESSDVNGLTNSKSVQATKDESFSDERWEDYGGGVNSNYADEASSKESRCTNESLGKSDRIYTSCKAFSNEEIVEHLRRLDDDENSIISNILSLDFDDSTMAGLFEGKDGRHSHNTHQSRFSFANQDLDNSSLLHDSRENQDSFYKPQYQASRVQNFTPPGFSKPPPGFPSSMRNDQVVSTNHGSYVKNCLSNNNHYRTPSIGNLSNNSDDFIDPAIMVVGRGKSFDEEANLWFLMQQQQHHQHDPHFSQNSLMQHHQTPQYSSYYGDLTSRHHHQSYTDQQYLQHKFTNGHQQMQFNEAQKLDSEKLLPSGYGEYMFQMPTSGDVYNTHTRVFGM